MKSWVVVSGNEKSQEATKKNPKEAGKKGKRRVS